MHHKTKRHATKPLDTQVPYIYIVTRYNYVLSDALPYITDLPHFATWAQSIENAMRLCNLDALSIALSKLQGAPLRSDKYLEDKESNSGKKLSWTTLKQHLTSNCSDIPYNTHAINAYDTLQQVTDESIKAY